MGYIVGFLVIGLIAIMLFSPPTKKEVPRCPLCQSVIPSKPKQKHEYGSILLLIVLIILLAYAQQSR